jgi:hypothetical protein
MASAIEMLQTKIKIFQMYRKIVQKKKKMKILALGIPWQTCERASNKRKPRPSRSRGSNYVTKTDSRNRKVRERMTAGGWRIRQGGTTKQTRTGETTSPRSVGETWESQ